MMRNNEYRRVCVLATERLTAIKLLQTQNAELLEDRGSWQRVARKIEEQKQDLKAENAALVERIGNIDDNARGVGQRLTQSKLRNGELKKENTALVNSRDQWKTWCEEIQAKLTEKESKS